jgi:hypothetical protein
MTRFALLFSMIVAPAVLAQVSAEEAAAKMREREASRKPTSQPYDESVALRKALTDSRTQAESLRQQNVQLKADLKKAQNPTEQEKAWQSATPDVGMTKAVVTKIYDMNNWDREPVKATHIVGNTPLEIQVWSRPNAGTPGNFRAVRVPQNVDTSSPRDPKPGQPDTVILVNGVVVYVSPS